MSWVEVARIKSADEAANVTTKRIEPRQGTSHGPFFKPNPFYQLLGNPKCSCNKSGYGCDRPDCGFTTQ